MLSGRDNVVHTWAATASGEWDCIDKINDDSCSELAGFAEEGSLWSTLKISHSRTEDDAEG